MSKKTGIIVTVLSMVALCLSIISLCVNVNQTKGKDTQYVLYLGTNDRDTYEPYGTPEVCKAKVDEVLTKHFEGFTIQEANGGWTNENGSVDHEYTIVIILSDTTLDKVHAAAKDLNATFNQSSILIQSNLTTTEFYDAR